MKSEIKNLFWFTKKSWYYLGCSRGSGRHKARRIFLKGLIPSYKIYRRLMKSSGAWSA